MYGYMIHGQLWLEFGQNLSACMNLLFASGINIWSVIIVAKICGTVRDQSCWLLPRSEQGSFLGIFMLWTNNVFWSLPKFQFFFFFLELYMGYKWFKLGSLKITHPRISLIQQKKDRKQKHLPFENQRYWLGWRYCISL